MLYRHKAGPVRRIAIFAPHFAEYAARLALEMAGTARVLLVLDAANRSEELEDQFFAAVRRAVDVLEVDTRAPGRGEKFAIISRILLFRPDVVHVQEQPDPLTAAVVEILRRFAPIVLTVHDPKPHSGRDAAYAQRQDKYRQSIRSAPEVYHVHGAFCRAELRSVIANTRPIVETFHGVILTPRPEQRLRPSSRRFLLFGRMEEYKGVEVLLDAADALSQRGTAFELVLAGRGPELDRLSARLSEAPDITVLNGYLTPSEAIREFQRAAVVVIPYLEATQSGIVAAAFGNGRPVIASAVGGLTEVVRHEINGLSVSAGSVGELAAAIDRIARDGDMLAQITDGAQASAREEMSWAEVRRRLSEAYQLAISERRGAKTDRVV